MHKIGVFMGSLACAQTTLANSNIKEEIMVSGMFIKYFVCLLYRFLNKDY